jgi:hypothetical protein
MGKEKISDLPLKHVISFRVTDSEKSMLENLASFHGIKLSTLMRESVEAMGDRLVGDGGKMFGETAGT